MTGCYRKHRFSADIDTRLKRCYTLDNWHGPLALLEDYAVIALAIAAPYLLRPWLGWTPVYLLVSLPLIACRMRALATVLHESAHHALARSRVLNGALGTLFSGYLILQTWNAYFSSHVLNHHPHLGDPERDPDYRYHIQEGLYNASAPSRFAWSALIKPLLLLKSPSKFMDLVKHRLLGPAQGAALWERFAMFAYITALSAMLIACGLGQELLLFWVVPFLTVFPAVGWYIELTEHFPWVADSDLDLEMSRNRWTGGLAAFFLGIHSEGYHLVHHLRPRIPFWRLEQAHRIMMDDPAYRTAQFRSLGFVVPILPGVPSIIESLMRRSQRR